MPREYFYRIDAEGRLFHDQSRLTDPQFLDFFFRRLQPNLTDNYPDYPFISLCGQERNFVQCEDTPIVYHTLTPTGYLRYAQSLQTPFQPEQLCFSLQTDQLYHPAPVGGVGRLAANLTHQLSPHLQPWGPFYSYTGGTQIHVIPPRELPNHQQILRPRPDNGCFACGGANPSQLRLSFLLDTQAQTAQTWLVPDERLQGAPGWMHGGMISLLLDEIMAKVLSGIGIHAVTGRLEVKFRKPVLLGKSIEVCGQLVETIGRKYALRGDIYQWEDSQRGTPLAEGHGLFVWMGYK
ncbi:MAG: DUF4505 domain-containing protein [Gemmatimonadetes bacterium]|nr:MAG: DUF4505 domain-containing protein [Gemmatimonadota bacterium]